MAHIACREHARDARLQQVGVAFEVPALAAVRYVHIRAGENEPTIIAIIDSRISFWGLYTAQTTVDRVYPDLVARSYYFALHDPVEAGQIAREIESALLTYGVQSTSIRDEQIEEQRWYTGILTIMSSFFGLGLVVGIAAVGVARFAP